MPIGVIASGERRLEGETYLTGGYAIKTRMEASGEPHAPLSALARVWQPNRLKGVAVDREHGVPFLTATQVFDIRPSPRKWLAPSRTDDFESRVVQRGWILVTRSGNVGDAMIAYDAHLATIISDDLLRVEPLNEDRGYLYAFLRCKYGRAMLRSSHYGSIIKHLEPEHLEALPVPILKNGLKRELEEKVTRVFALRDEAFGLVKQAEGDYIAALGIDQLHESDESAYAVSATEMFSRGRRLDGYHYNPAAEAAIQAIHRSNKPLVPLSSLVMRLFGVPRFKHIYADDGTPYVDSEDIFKINPEVTKFIPRVSDQQAATYFVRSGWILMACSGQLYGLNGNSVLADASHEGRVISNHVIRIVPKANGIRVGYLQMALSHPLVGRPLVLRLAFGTEVPEIAPDDLNDFPVPRLGVQEDVIADLIERASKIRLEAMRLEEEAVGQMEQFMEAAYHLSASDAPVEEGCESSAEEG